MASVDSKSIKELKKFSSLSEDEKNKVILDVSDFIIKNKASIRKASQYALNSGIKISPTGIHDNIYKRLPELSEKKYIQVTNVLSDNKSKSIEEREIEQRVKTVGVLFLQGYTIEKIATDIKLPVEEIYEDLTVRLIKMFPHMKPDIDKRLESLNSNDSGLKQKKYITEQKTIRFENLKPEVIKEMALMCLTYRISFKNLKKLLNIEDTEDDIKNYIVYSAFSLTTEEKFKENLIYSDFDLEKALNYLEFETENEMPELSDYAFQQGYSYLKRRKQILKNLSKSKKDNNQNEIDKNKRMLKKNTSFLDDSIAIGAIGKKYKELTEEEKEAIPRYRIKYGISKNKCSKILCMHKSLIATLEEELSAKDPIFRTQIQILNAYHEINRNEIEIVRR